MTPKRKTEAHLGAAATSPITVQMDNDDDNSMELCSLSDESECDAASDKGKACRVESNSENEVGDVKFVTQVSGFWGRTGNAAASGKEASVQRISKDGNASEQNEESICCKKEVIEVQEECGFLNGKRKKPTNVSNTTENKDQQIINGLKSSLEDAKLKKEKVGAERDYYHHLNSNLEKKISKANTQNENLRAQNDQLHSSLHATIRENTELRWQICKLETSARKKKKQNERILSQGKCMEDLKNDAICSLLDERKRLEYQQKSLNEKIKALEDKVESQLFVLEAKDQVLAQKDVLLDEEKEKTSQLSMVVADLKIELEAKDNLTDSLDVIEAAAEVLNGIGPTISGLSQKLMFICNKKIPVKEVESGELCD